MLTTVHPTLNDHEYNMRPACCYELMSLESDNRTTLVLSNTRELNRVPNTK